MKKILISGASGLIGSTLSNYLTQHGYEVIPLVRNATKGSDFSWRPDIGEIKLNPNTELDAVIHLAGANLADKRWNQNTKNLIIDSRETSTRLLCETLAKLPKKPKVLISASAIGFYGDRGDTEVDEFSGPGAGFLPEVSLKWEQATQAASNAGIRTVLIRTGVVLSDQGGMLKKLLLPFKLGLGGVIGSGKQYLSWVSIKDVNKMIYTLLENDSLSGPVNLVSNNPTTNADFVKTLGEVLHRPTLIPMPGFLAKLAFGEMAEELLLSGVKVTPKKLNEFGYEFENDNLSEALKKLLK